MSATTFRAVAGWGAGRLGPALHAAIALLLSLVGVGVIIAAVGANPLEAYRAIVEGALGTTDATTQTVMVAVPLALTGLAAAIPFSARLWNVGAEGQMHVGAFAAVAIALTLPAGLPAVLMIPLCVLAALGAGAAWAGIAGVLKAAVGANEVIVTLMLNFVGILLATYAITGIWPEGIAPQTEKVPGSALLPTILPGTALNLGVLIALAAVVVAWVVMHRTGLGLEIRSIGLNPFASRLNGMNVAKVTVVTFLLAGAFAGIAGSVEVTGDNGALVSNFSASYGFIGIAVALVARLDPLWIVPSAMLFAVLQVGSQSLPAAVGVSTAFGAILISVFIIALLAARVITLRYAEGAVQ